MKNNRKWDEEIDMVQEIQDRCLMHIMRKMERLRLKKMLNLELVYR